MNIFISIAIALAAGILFGKLAGFIKFPAVTGYFIAGILIGPYVLGRTGIAVYSEGSAFFEGLIKAAFGFICFSLGAELNLNKLKTIGKNAVAISLVQALAAAILVDVVLVLIAVYTDILSVPDALMLGALAAASAPTAKYMVTRQYRSEGKVTDMMLPVVALDDAFAIVIFFVSGAAAQAINSGELNLYTLFLSPLIELVGSVLLGILLGVIYAYVVKLLKSEGGRAAAGICLVTLAVGIIEAIEAAEFTVGGACIEFSSLLVCMVLGSVFRTINKDAHHISENLDAWTYPLFVLFFVFSGSSLDFGILRPSAILIGVAYFVARACGKYFGTYCGAVMVKEDINIRKYLGFTLLPQADVVIALATVAVRFMGAEPIVQSIVIFAALIFELVGGPLTRYGIYKAGEVMYDDENLPEEKLHETNQ